MFSKPLANRLIVFLLAANLMMGLGRVATLPPFEGFDETAHYSRLEAEAFAPPGTPTAFITQDVENYYAHGPVSPRWIFARKFNNAYHEALTSRKPLDLAGQMKKKEAYTDYHRFFAQPSRWNEYETLYRQQPAAAAFTSTNTPNWQFQHPPLYYVLFGKLLRPLKDTPLISRLFALRALSYLTAFLGFVIGLFATVRHLESRNVPGARAIGVLGAFYPFVMPVFFEEFARLGNDSLCALLFGITWALVLWFLRQPREMFIWVLLGIVMGLSYLTKMLMFPADLGLLIFIALQKPDQPGLANRLKPAATAGAIAFVIGYLSTLNGGFVGSLELEAWLHGRGYVSATGIPWSELLFNIQTMLTSMVYNFGDMAMFGMGTIAVGAMFLALLYVLARWLLALPRDPRREEWLPLYPLSLMLGGLFLHAVLGAFAYRADHVAVTPARYIHVEAPALMLIFGAGLWRILQSGAAGRGFAAILFIAAIALNGWITAVRLAFFAGCAWIHGDYSGAEIDLGKTSCAPNTIYEHLALLAEPKPGLVLLALAFLLLLGSTAMLFLRLKPWDNME